LADSVGLGKTIEVGVLLAELMRRGKGKRILVVTTKSMMTQFQKELWSRFTIPLLRLDRAGIDRIRQDVPADANPFHYYDKTIISVDMLKQERDFRVHLERSYWDIIVIDEAHNVAVAGTRSARAKLAELLGDRSDTMILASATPHDGRPESFASLMNMLNPTAITNPKVYGRRTSRACSCVALRRTCRNSSAVVPGAQDQSLAHPCVGRRGVRLRSGFPPLSPPSIRRRRPDSFYFGWSSKSPSSPVITRLISGFFCERCCPACHVTG
jgi:hypothetical protein